MLETVEGFIRYTVEENGAFNKYSTSEMLKMYPTQLVQFLEESLL